MSWDVTLFRSEVRTRFVDELRPTSLGLPAFAKRWISNALPHVVWRANEGACAQDGCAFQFELDVADGVVGSVRVAVRGDGDPLAVLRSLCGRDGWAVFDAQSGELLDLTAPTIASWERFRGGAGESLVAPAATRRMIVFYDLDGPPELGPDGYFRRRPIGPASTVRARVVAQIAVTWQGDVATFDDGDTRLELRLRSKGTIDTFDASGAGPGLDALLARICGPNGWAAFDCTEGEFCFPRDLGAAPVK